MSGFEIDTGATDFNPAHTVPEWFRYEFDDPHGLPVLKAWGQHIIGQFNREDEDGGRWKALRSYRQHLLRNWAFMAQLAEHYPETFDEILQSYAARVDAG